jgi:hypothetical protein
MENSILYVFCNCSTKRHGSYFPILLESHLKFNTVIFNLILFCDNFQCVYSPRIIFQDSLWFLFVCKIYLTQKGLIWTFMWLFFIVYLYLILYVWIKKQEVRLLSKYALFCKEDIIIFYCKEGPFWKNFMKTVVE